LEPEGDCEKKWKAGLRKEGGEIGDVGAEKNLPYSREGKKSDGVGLRARASVLHGVGGGTLNPQKRER